MNINDDEHNQNDDAKPRFAAHRRPGVVSSARDAWDFFNRSRIVPDDARFIGTALALIGTAIGIASSTTYLIGGIASRTPESDPVRLKLRIHNYTPYVITLRNARNVSSRVWSSPVILSGQTQEIPYSTGTNLNATPIVDMVLVDEQRSVLTFNFTITDNGRFVRVTNVHFQGAPEIADPYPGENHRENGSVIYRGARHNGIIPTLISSSITNGMDGEIDVSLLTSASS